MLYFQRLSFCSAHFSLILTSFFVSFVFFLALFSFLAHAEWNRLRNYHRLQKIIETITMQRAIKSTITQRNIIHTSPCMMMKSKILAISTEMVSSSMNCSYWNGLWYHHRRHVFLICFSFPFCLVFPVHTKIKTNFADYPSQYNNNRNPSQPKYVQTTYRPSTVTTQTQSTSTKIVQPQTFISNAKPIYDQPPTHEAYNPEYDEALVAQVSVGFLFFWPNIEVPTEII